MRKRFHMKKQKKMLAGGLAVCLSTAAAPVIPAYAAGEYLPLNRNRTDAVYSDLQSTAYASCNDVYYDAWNVQLQTINDDIILLHIPIKVNTRTNCSTFIKAAKGIKLPHSIISPVRQSAIKNSHGILLKRIFISPVEIYSLTLLTIG